MIGSGWIDGKTEFRLRKMEDSSAANLVVP
jgi:hypothetical protein